MLLPPLHVGEAGPTLRSAIGPAARAAGRRVGIVTDRRWIMWDADAWRYRGTLEREVDHVGGVEIGWPGNEPTQGAFDFWQADPVHAWVASVGLGTMPYLVVDRDYGVPAWVSGLNASQAEAALRAWIAEVLTRFPDPPLCIVVNEPITNNAAPGTFVQGPGVARLFNHTLAQKLGGNFIRIAFDEAAQRVGDGTRLILNEIGLAASPTHTGTAMEYRAQAILDIADDLIGQGIRIDGIGEESHLWWDQVFNAAHQANLLNLIADRGLSFHVTELDHMDHASYPADPAARDAFLADRVATWLGMCLAHPITRSVHVWGVHDGNSWFNDAPFARTDGLEARPLPWDRQFQKKPMYDAIRAALAAYWGS